MAFKWGTLNSSKSRCCENIYLKGRSQRKLCPILCTQGIFIQTYATCSKCITISYTFNFDFSQACSPLHSISIESPQKYWFAFLAILALLRYVILTFSVPTFSWHTHYQQKIGCNSADFCYRNTNCKPNERYYPQLFSPWVIFWNHFPKTAKICFWKFHFLRRLWKSTRSQYKGLTLSNLIFIILN